ncbi:MAG: hypothetical protein HY897_04830 [Deltaproteobacteria bacterium]|nr:hypothetical protein [Deltaproteobacteria bacterium]
MRKALVAAAVLVSLVTFSRGAAAAGLSLFSGRTLGSSSAVNVSAGIPDASLVYLTPYAGNADWGAFVRLGYLTPIGSHGDNVWTAFGGSYKQNLRNYGKYNMGLQIDFGPAMWLSPDFMAGFTLGPALLIGVPLKDVATLDFGIGVPFMIFFKDGVFVNVPIGFKMGCEFFVDQSLTLNANFEIGPGIQTFSDTGKKGTKSATNTDVYALFKVGITFGL